MKINTTGKINKGLKKKVHFIKEPFGLPFELSKKDVFLNPNVPKGDIAWRVGGRNVVVDKDVLSGYRVWQKYHTNFMTPELLKVYKGDGFIVEVSGGDDFEHKPIYGVSIVNVKLDRSDTTGYKFSTSDVPKGFNKPIRNREEAFSYAESLSKKSKSELFGDKK
jgi:hypothetical protein